jgi:nitronate monooxygenase
MKQNLAKKESDIKLPTLKIRGLTSKFPVIQAGMGVRIGMSRLASETIKLGGFGTIASVGIGDVEEGKIRFVGVCSENLALEIREAKRLSDGKKPLGVNIMVALSNYKEITETAVQENVDFIISGAGLPISLPEYVGDKDIALIPVVSGARALDVILKAWKRRYNRTPDAVIVEGPRCGGHLGFSMDQLNNQENCSLSKLYAEVKALMVEHGLGHIPLIGAGEVSSRESLEALLKIGFDGAQIGTFFIASEESGIDPRSKEVYVNAKNSDVVILKSPVGLPVRVLKTKLVERVLSGSREKFTCPYRCLRTCDPKTSLFCIAKALLATWSGDIDNALFMTGCDVDSIKRIYPLKEFFDTLEDK